MNLKILLVENNDNNRCLAQFLLERAGRREVSALGYLR